MGFVAMSDERRAGPRDRRDDDDVGETLGRAFTDEQVKALRYIWNINGQRLDGIRAYLKKGFGVLILAFLLLGAVNGIIGAIGLVNLHNNHQNTLKITASTVTSRYDAAYLSCLTSDNSHVLAAKLVKQTLTHPTTRNIEGLLDALRPLRSADAPDPPELPKVIPNQWKHPCQRYARNQIAVNPAVGSIPGIQALSALTTNLTTTTPSD
jgi:hypothetical protein